MKPPTPGLRPIYNRSSQVAKPDLRIAPGDALQVSDAVAEQLIGQGFVEGEPSAEYLEALAVALTPPSEPDDPGLPVEPAAEAPAPAPVKKKAAAKKAPAKD